jgi:hypothetical protein
MSRARSCMWRLVPRMGTYQGSGIGDTSLKKNNSFTLEVMFDTPILHIDTPFPKINFASNSISSTCNPYKNLTLSGQAMVRYSDLTQTAYAS